MTVSEWPVAHSPRCDHCGAHVTDRFRRVFGDDHDIAHRCPECDSWVRLSAGTAAGVEVDLPDPEKSPQHRPNRHAGWS